MKLISALLAAMALFTVIPATAQWQWVDKDGHKVFSDRAPPADIPDKNIVKRPATRAQTAVTGEDEKAQAAGVPPAAAEAPKGTGVDKELEAKKKQAADAEAAKRKADEERITKAKIENCARAKQAQATYASGVRISRTNASGEREVLDDAARATETKRIQSIIDTDCR